MANPRDPRERRPHRRPVGGRRSEPRERLVRFVLDEHKRLVPDIPGRMAGRGLWLEADRRTLESAAARRTLGRLGVREFDAGRLASEVERQLERRCLDLLGLAQRARAVVIGFEAVRRALLEEKAAVVLVARDASPHARKRFRHLPEGTVRVEAFDRAALGRALGREDVVYAALLPGKLARRFVADVGRLAGFRPVAAEGVPDGPAPRDEDETGHE
jgi:predicted RNA-binding protein YlxR (DUF448 family)